MGKIENLILQHSGRGMDVLRPYLAEDFCTEAADAILTWERGTVVLTTGFYVAGHAETDGPPGTLLLARALEHCGFRPFVVTDEPCRGYFEQFDLSVHYFSQETAEDVFAAFLEEIHPVGLISVERCGENIRGDYANMRGVSIAIHTAPIDRMFAMAQCPTVGVGDGGNEIGMGKLADVISEQLSLVPCKVPADYLVIATVSNWGALGLSAALGRLPEEKEFLRVYEIAQKLGYVDGMTKECTLSEDGFSLEVGKKLLNDLKATNG